MTAWSIRGESGSDRDWRYATREEAFNVAFKSFEKYMISARNKIIIKIIIKKFVPAWVIKYYKTRQMARHMGGVEETASSQDAIDNIRLSVLKFLQCYK